MVISYVKKESNKAVCDMCKQQISKGRVTQTDPTAVSDRWQVALTADVTARVALQPT